MALKAAAHLYLHKLPDTYSAEKQLIKSLPRMARASADPQPSQAFLDHLEETQGQVARIDEVVELLNLKLKRIKCAAMEDLVEEGKDLIDEIEKGPVLDVALIGAAQKVEHDEIASYTTLTTLTTKLRYTAAVPLLQASLAEERATDERLGKLGQAAAIKDAAAAGKARWHRTSSRICGESSYSAGGVAGTRSPDALGGFHDPATSPYWSRGIVHRRRIGHGRLRRIGGGGLD